MSIGPETVSFELGIWGKRIAFLILAFMAVVVFFELYNNVEIDSFDSEAESFVYATLYSSHGLSYQDPVSGRFFPGTISIEKIKNSTLDKTISYGSDNLVGAEITLKDLGGKQLAHTIYNPLTYDRFEDRGIKGPGGVDVKSKTLYVLIKDNQKLTQGILEYNIVVERS